MGAETIGTLVAVALAVGVIAVALIALTWRLKRIDAALGRVEGGVRTVADQVAPVGGVVGTIAGETRTIAEALTGVVAFATEITAARAAAGGERAIDLREGDVLDGVDGNGMDAVMPAPVKDRRPAGGRRRRREAVPMETR